MKKVMKFIAIFLVAAMLVIPAYAATDSFTPSVTQKGAPEVVETQDKNGNPAAVIVYDENGEEVGSLPAGGIQVTPLTDAQDEDTPVAQEIREALTEAYDSIDNAGSLAEAAPKVEEALKEMDTELTMSELVVRDVFHVLLDQATVEAIENSQKVALAFDMEMEQDDFVMIMRYVDGEWIPVDPACVVINADGSVTVTLDLIDGKVGTIAFLTEMITEE